MSTRCVKLKYTLAKMQTDVSKDKACLIKNVNRCIVSSYSIPWLKFTVVSTHTLPEMLKGSDMLTVVFNAVMACVTSVWALRICCGGPNQTFCDLTSYMHSTYTNACHKSIIFNNKKELKKLSKHLTLTSFFI